MSLLGKNFSENSQKTPEVRLTSFEAPVRKETMDEVDLVVASMYPHAVRAEQLMNAQSGGAEVSEIDLLLQRVREVRAERGYDVQEAA